MSERVVIVGPGRMGLALGAALAQAGAVERLLFFGRSLDPPPHPLFAAGSPRVEYCVGPHPVPAGTTALILAVPDSALSEVAHEIAAMGPAPAGCAALHLAGAVSTDVLAPLHAVGYATGTLHPFQAVADPWAAGDRLWGSAFAIAGDPAAMATSRRLVRAVGGRALVVPPALRPLYHAAAVFASNYLVALAGVGVRLLGEAGIEEKDAIHAIVRLMRGTLENLDHLGIRSALTGPIPRGDVDTVRLHLARLSPDARMLYCALGRELLRLARGAGLDPNRAAELESLLSLD